MKPTELEKIKKILETYIWHNGNSWDYEKATKELLSLIEAREKEAVEGFYNHAIGVVKYLPDGRRFVNLDRLQQYLEKQK